MSNTEIYDNEKSNICYFRTRVSGENTKVLLQITDRCNMFCKHCFVKSKNNGNDLNYEKFLDYYVPFLQNYKTKKVTLTGGEPMLNCDIVKICEWLSNSNIRVTICTNGYTKDIKLLNELLENENVLFNISLDGFSEETISNFRGCDDGYKIVKNNIRYIASKNRLKGILCTPNKYGTVEEYIELAKFAKDIKAKYILFNPIGAFGRGSTNISSCSVDENFLSGIMLNTECLQSDFFQISYIRFPNIHKYDYSYCNPNGLYYIYVNGDIVGCPYISFAQKTMYNDISQSIIGNVYKSYKSKKDSDKFIMHKTCLAHEILDRGLVCTVEI